MQKSEKNGGLSIAGFSTSAGGLLLSLTIIGAFIGIPAMIVGLILAIIALVNKQKYKGLAISAIAITGITLIVFGFFLSKTKELVGPIFQSVQEIQSLIQNDPELMKLMEDETFKKTFEANFEKRVETRKFDLEQSLEGNDGKPNLSGFTNKMADIIREEIKAAILETKEQLKE